MNSTASPYPLISEINEFTADLPASDYIAEYREPERFLACCRECGNYARRWGCPPFDGDTAAVLRPFDRVHILAAQVVFAADDIPLSRAHELILPVRKVLDNRLLQMEHVIGGMAFTFTGQCPYCEPLPCARIEGDPCRHPHLVRPSLEAYGFNLDKTARSIFRLPMQWGTHGFLPSYLLLIGALFHKTQRPDCR